MADLDKRERVYSVFQNIASGYDSANDRISMYMQRFWKRRLIKTMEKKVPAGGKVLDVCCGTGDIALWLHERRSDLQITGLDFSPAMLAQAKKKRRNRKIRFTLGDALALPFKADAFDAVVVSFGLRNTADYEKTIMEMHRVLKPGGILLCMDSFVPGARWVRPFYTFYFKYLMPLIGGGRKHIQEYRWLHESTEKFLNKDAVKQLFEKAGCRNVRSTEWLFGACVMIYGRG